MDITDEVKNAIASELTNYINIHQKNDFTKTVDGYSLQKHSFEEIIAYLQSQNLAELIEKSLEDLCHTFSIDMAELFALYPTCNVEASRQRKPNSVQ